MAIMMPFICEKVFNWTLAIFLCSWNIFCFSLESEKPIYAFGNYQIEEGKFSIKLGPLAADEIPPGFPQTFLESDGSYPGGLIYLTVAEAAQALLEVKQKGLIPEEGDWGVFQLEGNWDDYAYELRPHEFHLNKSTPIIKRI